MRGVVGDDGVMAGLHNRFGLDVERDDTEPVSLRRTEPVSDLLAVGVRNPKIVLWPTGTAIFTGGDVLFGARFSPLPMLGRAGGS